MPYRWTFGALLCLLLFIYAQTGEFSFINYDDDGYVKANAWVLQGLAPESVAWAFTSTDRFYWHPLTWLSLMTDVELFGAEPGKMHLVNLLLHLATVALVFLTLSRLTGRPGRSLAVTALFAVHPLRVESVAWIAERKDVLSALLMAATLFAYERYVRSPSRNRYLATLAVFLLACMAKPMAVIVPVLLLLLDFWPLRRRAILEKAPFAAVAVLVGAITYTGQSQMGALDMSGPLPLALRLQNAVSSLGMYIWQTIYPAHFAILYPYPTVFPIFVPAAVALALISAVAVWQRSKRPWILAGWLWFVIGLAPTLGFIQAGLQSRADRFTYIPHIGLLIVVVWGAAEILPVLWARRTAVACVLVLTFISYVQASTWRNSETVFAHALAHTENNWFAELKYGIALDTRGDRSGAKFHLLRSAKLNPTDPHSRFHLGRVAAAEQQIEESVRWFQETIRLKPNYADAHFSHGKMLAQSGREPEALQSLEQALKLGLAPEWQADAHTGAGVLLARQGKIAAAEAHFRSAVELQPGSQEARRNLAVAQEQLRRTIDEKF